MMRTTGEQLLVFALLVLYGMFLGVIFDGYRILRRRSRHRSFLTAIGEGCFWLLLTVGTFRFVMWMNQGIIRVYVFLALGLGELIYSWLWGFRCRMLLLYWLPRISHVIVVVLRAAGRPLVFAARVVSWPVRMVSHRMKRWFRPPPKEKI